MKYYINYNCKPLINKIMKLINKKGFTLVELLVVISIIGLLSSFAIVSLNDARVKARDAVRKGDMAQIRTALNIYYDDYGYYPTNSTCENNWDEDLDDYGATADTNGSGCYNILDGLLVSISRPYISKLPVDPKNQTNNSATDNTYLYRYVTNPGGKEYALVYTLESGGEQLIRGW